VLYYLEHHEMSQAGLAKLMGVSERHFSNVLNGRRPLTRALALRIAYATHMDADELLALVPLPTQRRWNGDESIERTSAGEVTDA